MLLIPMMTSAKCLLNENLTSLECHFDGGFSIPFDLVWFGSIHIFHEVNNFLNDVTQKAIFIIHPVILMKSTEMQEWISNRS